MKKEIHEEVLQAFSPPTVEEKNITIEALGGGLINHTYKISASNTAPFLLQRINKYVFPNPHEVQENYIHIWQYAEFEFTGLRLPAPRYCGRMTTLFVDRDENYWRAFEFINDGEMHNVATKPEQAGATAKAFARFTASFEDFNVQLLQKVIPGFHNLSLRYRQFEDALKGEYYERISKSLSLIQQLKERERYKHFYEIITESEQFPLRVMHHDAKISNVLFSRKNGRVICPIDFDTVMPGYFFSDLGDMIRSMACCRDENSIEFDHLCIRKDYYEAIVNNYLSVMENQFTFGEKNYIHYAGLLMTYMQSLRFLTDYLNGDIYYSTDYAEQNFDRAYNQLVLLQKLEEFLQKEYGLKLS
jgi:thiamine kinase-like enzyme